MNWLSLLGLEDWVARWHASALDGAIAMEDRMELAQLEWQEQKRRLQQLLLLGLAAFGLTVVALVALSLAVLVQFWDAPQRTLVAWLVAGVWLLVWGCAVALLLSLLRRCGRGFALTRRELAQDWRDIKERL